MPGVKYLKISAYVTALVEFLLSKAGQNGSLPADRSTGGVGDGKWEEGGGNGGRAGGEEGRYDIILHEPGFLHLLPALSLAGQRGREGEGEKNERQRGSGGEGARNGSGACDWSGALGAILCVSADAVQVDHLRRCSSE